MMMTISQKANAIPIVRNQVGKKGRQQNKMTQTLVKCECFRNKRDGETLLTCVDHVLHFRVSNSFHKFEAAWLLTFGFACNVNCTSFQFIQTLLHRSHGIKKLAIISSVP